MDNNNNNCVFSEPFILAFVGALGGLLSMFCVGMRKSRCKNISCCWHMFDCDREIMTKDELALEQPSPKGSNKV